MEKMAEAASADILVIIDSDTSVSKDYLQRVAAAFAPERVGAATNTLIGGAPGADLWSKLEALGMSTEFMAGVVVANHLEGNEVHARPLRWPCAAIAYGRSADSRRWPTMWPMISCSGSGCPRPGTRSRSCRIRSTTTRRRWDSLAASNTACDGTADSRFSRPAGYVGQGFTYGLPWALLLFLAAPFWWSGSLLLAVAAARFSLAYELGLRLLDDHEALRRFWLIPLQDMLSFATWIGGFVGREVVWRNERYRLLEGGRFEPVIPRGSNKSEPEYS